VIRTAALGCLLLIAVLPRPAPAAAGDPDWYGIDPVHTRVAFLVGHAGFSRSIATASGARGVLHFDAGAPLRSRVEVTLPATGIDFGDADWNQRMLRRGFFNARRHPDLGFRSTSVEDLGGGRLRVTGELSVAGRTREVALDTRFNAEGPNPVNRRRTVGFSATTTLDRRDFGMDAFPNAIGNEVELIIEVEAVRGRTSDQIAPPDARREPARAADEEDS